MPGKVKMFLILGTVYLLFALMCGKIFFSKEDVSAMQMESAVKIGVTYKDYTNPFFENLDGEIRSKIDEHGDILITRDAMGNAEKQGQEVEELLRQGIRALIITPVDYEKIIPYLEKASEAGVYIIVLDSPILQEDLADATITSDNVDVGQQLGRFLLSQRESGIGLILMDEGSIPSAQREKGFRFVVEQAPGYEIAGTLKCRGTAQSAMETVEQAQKEGLRFDFVFATNDIYAEGAAAACQKNPQYRQVDILGTDGSPKAKNLIKKEKMMATAAQFPREIAEKTADAIYRLLEGKQVERNIKVPVKLITKYTITSYDVEKWQ